MELLRSCYKSSMRLYKDRPDVLTPGRWVWVDEDAGPMPFATLYASRIWDPDPLQPDQPIGEVRDTMRWVNGSSTPLPRRGWCGTKQQWQEGSNYADAGLLPLGQQDIPLCCGGSVVIVGLRVDQADGSPVELDTTWITLSNFTGLALEKLEDGHVLIKGIPAENSQWGVVTNENQTWHGNKTLANGIQVGPSASGARVVVLLDGVPESGRTFLDTHASGVNAYTELVCQRRASSSQFLVLRLRPREDQGCPVEVAYLGVDASPGIFPKFRMMDRDGDARDGQHGTDVIGNEYTGGILTAKATELVIDGGVG